ncbi:MAG: RHS repeat-associated core domain-containing protein, partial [Bacteroidota bacterium]
GLVSVTRVTSSGTATYYPLADGNGNITDYVDASGTIVAHREYDAFGNTIVASGAMVNDFNFWFSTKYWDGETGKGYWGYRYYHPDEGRWLSRDPLGEMGGTLLYSFVRNDAIGYYDARGQRITKSVIVTGDSTDNLRKGQGPTIQVVIKATIQLLGCPGPKAGEEDLIKKEIEGLWTVAATDIVAWYGHGRGVVIQYPDVKMKVSLQTTVDIKYVENVGATTFDKDRHTYYLIDRKSSGTDRSHVKLRGGSESWIYSEDHNTPWTYAHEFGHFLGLKDRYTERQSAEGTLESVVNDPIWNDNIMAVKGGKALHVLTQIYGFLRDAVDGSDFNLGLPITANQSRNP